MPSTPSTAHFKITGSSSGTTLSAAGGHVATHGETLTLQLEDAPALDVLAVQFSISQLTKGAPALSLSASGVPSPVTGTVTATAPGSGAHSYMVRCAATTASGLKIFERVIALLSANASMRKQLPAETGEFDPAQGWSSAQNDMVDAVDAAIGSIGSAASAAVRAIAVYITNITLSGAAPSTDGISPANDDKVLVTAQTLSQFNGVWKVNTGGAWTRATELSLPEEFSGVIVGVLEGTSYKDTLWQCTTDNPIVVDTTPLAFAQIPNRADKVKIDELHVSISQFGASPAASAATNATAIQNAISAVLTATHGGSVYVPAGQFSYNASINANNTSSSKRLRIYGDGPASILSFSGAAPEAFVATGCYNVEFEKLHFVGTVSRQISLIASGAAVGPCSVRDCILEGCTTGDPGVETVAAIRTLGAQDLSIERNVFKNNGRVRNFAMAGAGTLTFAASGKTITRSSGSWITDFNSYLQGWRITITGTASNNGTFFVKRGVSQTATVLTIADTYTLVNETISSAGVSITAVYGYGYEVLVENGADNRRVHVRDNTFTAANTIGSVVLFDISESDVLGNVIDGGGLANREPPDSFGDDQGYGIVLYSFSPTLYNRIAHNHVRNCCGSGCYLQNVNHSIVADNTFEDVCKDQDDTSLLVGAIAANVGHCSITGNLVNGSGKDGIVVAGDDVAIVGNKVLAHSKHGIEVNGAATHIAISGNVVNGGARGIVGAQGASERIAVVGNVIQSCSIAGVYFSETYESIVQGNSIAHCTNNGIVFAAGARNHAANNVIVDSTADFTIYVLSSNTIVEHNILQSCVFGVLRGGDDCMVVGNDLVGVSGTKIAGAGLRPIIVGNRLATSDADLWSSSGPVQASAFRGSGLDVPSAGTLSIGTSVATEVDIGNAAITTKLFGTLSTPQLTAARVVVTNGSSVLTTLVYAATATNDSIAQRDASGFLVATGFKGASLDVASAAALSIGTGAATSIAIGSGAITTTLDGTVAVSILSASQVVVTNASKQLTNIAYDAAASNDSIARRDASARLLASVFLAPSFDTATAISLALGGSSATAVKIGSGAIPIGFYGAAGATQQTITGSRGGNAALADLLTKLASTGLLVDSTS